MPEFLRSFPGIEEALFGILLVIVILLRPSGLASLLAVHLPMFRQRFYRER